MTPNGSTLTINRPSGWERLINKVTCMDCLKGMKDMPDNYVDLVVTDPPYPDIEKGFKQTEVGFLSDLECRQFIFWSAVEPFPLDWTAVHVWHKPNGQTSQHYERIFERNGQKVCRVWRIPIINYKTLPEWTSHPTQKPLRLIRSIVSRYSKPGDLILDPFMGSGTTAVACKQLGRRFIGFEINPKYVDICNQRLAQGVLGLTRPDERRKTEGK